MSDAGRDELLRLFRESVGARPVRWLQGPTALGDFEGRAETVEVFDVPAGEQRALLAQLRPVRDDARRALGGRVRVLFHTPEATTRYYSEVRTTEVALALPQEIAVAADRRVRIVDQDVLSKGGAARRDLAAA